MDSFKSIISVAIILFILTIVYYVAYVGSAQTTDICVNDKERIVERTGEGLSSKYLVFAENEVFENTDTILFMKFNSSDLHNSLEVGKCYNVKVVGWRINIFSMYRNIGSAFVLRDTNAFNQFTSAFPSARNALLYLL